MNLTDLVLKTEELERVLEGLTEDQLDVFESCIVEGAETDFTINSVPALATVLSNLDDDTCSIIKESVFGDQIVESFNKTLARTGSVDHKDFVTEALADLSNIDVATVDVSTVLKEGKEDVVQLMSLVAEALVATIGEEEALNVPAEALADLTIAVGEAGIEEDGLSDIVEGIKSGKFDIDFDNYKDGTNLIEFLSDVEADMLVEGNIVNENAELAEKFNAATRYLVEGTKTQCHGTTAEVKACKIKKAAAAKHYYNTNGYAHNKALDSEDIHSARLRKYVLKAKLAAKKMGTHPSGEDGDDYVKFVLIPALIKKMRAKGRHEGMKDKKFTKGATIG